MDIPGQKYERVESGEDRSDGRPELNQKLLLTTNIPTAWVLFETRAEKLFNLTLSNGCTRDNLIGLFKYFDVRMLGSDWF